MSRAVIALIDDRSARGVHLSNDGDKAFEMLSNCYQDKNRAEAIIAFGDMYSLGIEPIGCRFYEIRSGQPFTGKTLERLVMRSTHDPVHLYLFDARSEPQPPALIVTDQATFISRGTVGAWTAFELNAIRQAAAA